MIGKFSISSLPSVKFDGVYRVLACLPETEGSVLQFPRFGTSMAAPLDPSQWREIDLEWYKAPILDQGMTSSCFPAGTRIRMANGTQKNIEKIQLLDEVLTAEGNVGKVTQLFVREEKDSVIKLCLWGHNHLKMTEEHPILTKRGYVQIKDLTLEDWVILPKYLPKLNNIIQTGEYLQARRRNTIGKRCMGGVLGRKISTICYCKPPDIINLTANTGRIFGLFLAEGCTTRDKIVWTFGKHEEDTLVKELVGLLKDEWGVEAHVKRYKKTSTNIEVYGRDWASLFEGLFSNGAGNKKIHSDIASGPQEFLESIFNGWLDGDGYERRNTIQGTTVSHDLALAMYDIAQALGKRPSIRHSEPKVSHGVKNRLPRWDIEIGLSNEDTYRSEQEEKCVWRKVRGIVKEDFCGHVYNMEVEGDNSYVAEGIGVHNCVGHGTCSGMEMCYMQSGRPLVPFTPYFTYGLINGGRDAGAMISDGLKALMQSGICRMGDIPAGVMFKNQFPQSAFEVAKRFRLAQAYHCGSFEEICAAISLGFVCPLGIMVGNNFPNLDSEGVAPLPAGGGGGHCVKPTSIICSPHMKQAKDVKVGDMVFGHDGCLHEVEEVFKRYYNGKLIKIHAIGNNVTTTEEHPILIYRRVLSKVAISTTVGFLEGTNFEVHHKNYKNYEAAWIKAKDVSIGDYIVVPKIKFNKSVQIPEWLTSGDSQAKKLNPIIPSEDLAWLFGYFIGDGSTCHTKKTRNKSIELIFATHDKHLLNRAIMILQKLGVNPKIKCETKNYIKLRVNSSTLGISFREWFGGYSHEKRIPSWMFSGWNLSSLLEGLMDSDGHITNNCYNIHCTVSPILAQQIRIISISLGNRATCSIAKRSKNCYANGKDLYITKWINGKQKIVRDTNDFILYPVIEVKKEHYSGDVYNYEIKDCHSYLVDTVAVHNCILGMGLKKSSKYGWLIKIQNSWGGTFGIKGHCYLQKNHFKVMNPDAFAIQSIIDDPQDNTPVDDVPIVT